MIDDVITIVRNAVKCVCKNGLLKEIDFSNFNPYVARSKDKRFDYTSRIAIKLASIQRIAPIKIAEIVIMNINFDGGFIVSVGTNGISVSKCGSKWYWCGLGRNSYSENFFFNSKEEAKDNADSEYKKWLKSKKNLKGFYGTDNNFG